MQILQFVLSWYNPQLWLKKSCKASLVDSSIKILELEMKS